MQQAGDGISERPVCFAAGTYPVQHLQQGLTQGYWQPVLWTHRRPLPPVAQNISAWVEETRIVASQQAQVLQDVAVMWLGNG